MSRMIALAVLASMLASTAMAVPPNQLVVPFLNPGLRTVPVAPLPSYPPVVLKCEPHRSFDGATTSDADDVERVITATSAKTFAAATRYVACPPDVPLSGPIETDATKPATDGRPDSPAPDAPH